MTAAELDAVIERAVMRAARTISLGPNGQFLEAWIEQALVAGIQAELGEATATAVKVNRFDLPDWNPKPYSFDARLFHADGSLRAAIECKVEKVNETLWDVYKLVAAAGAPGFEAGYAVVAATSKMWDSAGDCVALFAPPIGIERELESRTLFDEWRAAWAWLLQGGSARPTRVPGRIAVQLVAEAPLADQPTWVIRAIRVTPVRDSDWVEFGLDGWPREAGVGLRDVVGPGLPAPAALGPRFGKAVAYALHVHGGHLRKGTEIPYAAHLLAVVALVLENGGSEEEAIAALLHDAAEDQGGLERLADIRVRFGDGVAELVAACTDTFESPKPPWRARKEQYLTALRTKPEPALRVSLADKLHNARALLRDYEAVGDDLFERFSAGKEDQRWYYGELAEVFTERLAGNWMAAEFQAVVDQLRRRWSSHTEPTG